MPEHQLAAWLHLQMVKRYPVKRLYTLTKSVSVEAIGCEQLAQSRYAAAPWPWIELATS